MRSFHFSFELKGRTVNVRAQRLMRVSEASLLINILRETKRFSLFMNFVLVAFSEALFRSRTSTYMEFTCI